jgi:zinc transport system substrate-binding protein
MAVADDKPTVAVGIEPLKYFVDRLSGGAVEVVVMVSAGASPATYEPKPRQLVALSKADLYFAVEVPFERAWLPRFRGANEKMKIVKLYEGIERQQLAEHCHDHDHDHAHHDHGEMPDPHFWLSPRLGLHIGRMMLQEMQIAYPELALQMESNWRRFAGEIVALDTRLMRQFRDQRGAAFLVYHPSWGYFARDYGLRQVAVESGGREPRPAQLKKLIDQARSEGVRAVLIQPQFDKRSAETIASAVKAKVLIADPLASDWLGNLRTVADRVSSAVGTHRVGGHHGHDHHDHDHDHDHKGHKH